MENPSSEPAPELSTPPAAIPAPAPEAAEPPPDSLAALAQAAKAARLAPADEERAVALLKERLAGGRAGITAAAAPMVEGLPWIVCVNAVSAVWEQLSAPMRRHLVSLIAKNESEPARRLHLSLARAVFKLEPAAGLKLAAAATASLRHPETGELSAKHRQFFFNVFIGKGKPWLLQLPLGELKAAEADALVHAALSALPLCPPPAQLSILRWAHEAGRLKKASPAGLEIAAKAVARWNAKFQRQLKAEIADLPPVLEAALKPEALQPAPERPQEPAARPAPKKPKAEAATAPEPAQEKPEEPAEAAAPEGQPAPVEELVIPGRAERLAKKREAKPVEKPERKEHGERPERLERPERPERGAARAFDLKDALRGVESYVAGLRSELEQTKAQLRRKEQEPRRGSRSAARASEEQSPVEAEALLRHNARLEATVAELRHQLEDLASHHESVAESRALHTGEPLPEGSAEQLQALLAIKLQEAYEVYHAMRLEPLDKVFRLDYRDLLGSVFDTLRAAGVPLKPA